MPWFVSLPYVLVVGLLTLATGLVWWAIAGSLFVSPFDPYGRVDTRWFTQYLPGLLIVVVVVAGWLSGALWVVTRKRRGGRFLGGLFGMRWSFSLAFHPVVPVLALVVMASVKFDPGALSPYSLPGQWIYSDLGAERRATGRDWHDVVGISDQGLAAIAENSERLGVLRIMDSPEITKAGLESYGMMPHLEWMEFRAAGPDQAAWGDHEATLLTVSGELRRIDLHGFSRLSDDWLVSLPERCPRLMAVQIMGPHRLSGGAIDAFLSGNQDIELIVDQEFPYWIIGDYEAGFVKRMIPLRNPTLE